MLNVPIPVSMAWSVFVGGCEAVAVVAAGGGESGGGVVLAV